MLGSRAGIRDITKGVNDSRQAIRGMKIDLAKDPARMLELLIQERDAKIKEADAARDKAYGWGAKKFIQVADRADHHARKAEAQIQKLQADNPGLEPTHTKGRWERASESATSDVEAKWRVKAGEITKLEGAVMLQQNARNFRVKQNPEDGDAPIPQKSHAVAIALSVLLGFFGADRAYVGHYGLATAKMFSTLTSIGIIWWLVDVVVVATKGTARLQVVNWKQRGEALAPNAVEVA